MKKLPSLNSLRAFQMVSKFQSFSRCAEEMHVTQAAVSQQIKNLEDWVGAPLFNRLLRRVELTTEGKNLVFPVQHAFEILEEAFDQIQDKNNKANVNITTLASLGALWLVPLLRDFYREFPDIDLCINTSQHLLNLEKDGFDFGIRYGRGDWPNVYSEQLFAPNGIVVCSPSVLEKFHISNPVKLLEQVPLIFSGTFNHWEKLINKKGFHKLKPTAKINLDDFTVAIQAAIKGQGIALLPEILCQSDLKAGRLVNPFELKISMDVGYYLVWPKQKKICPQSKNTIEWLKSKAKMYFLSS